MNYAVDYAPVGDSVAYAWGNDSEARRILIKSEKASTRKSSPFSSATKKSRKAKSKTVTTMKVGEFLGSIGKEDIVYTELGGQNDKFCIAAHRTGAKMVRLPTWHISDEQRRQREQEGKIGDQIEEPASIIHRWAEDVPASFYPFREADLQFMEVRLLSRMFWTVQRKIRIAIANKLRHISQDLDFLGGPNGFPVTRQAIESVLVQLPADEQAEVDPDPKANTAIKFFNSLENSFKKQLEEKLNELPVYNAVFKPIPGCGVGIAGFVIASIMDIRRFPTFPKLKAYAGYHLFESNGKGKGGWLAPKATRGQRANWDHTLQQAVYYFTFVTNNQKPATNPWKAQLEKRYLLEIEKLLVRARGEGKDIPSDMNADRFMSEIVKVERELAATEDRVPAMPEPYKGIPALARKRAARWLGQQFLGYVYREWRRFEGLQEDEFKFGM